MINETLERICDNCKYKTHNFCDLKMEYKKKKDTCKSFERRKHKISESGWTREAIDSKIAERKRNEKFKETKSILWVSFLKTLKFFCILWIVFEVIKMLIK